MGWAVAAPVIGNVVGAVIGQRGQNRQIGAQERAAREQMAYQREQDAARQGRYDRAYKSYEAEKAQYDQIRRALLSHYGVNVGGGEAPAAGPDVRAGMGSTGAPGVSLPQLMGGGQFGSGPGVAPAPGDPQAAQAPMAEGDIFDWRNYGVR